MTAREKANRTLAEIEKRITEIYKRASGELTLTANDYFNNFERLDEKKRKDLKSGKISEKEYLEWRKNKILYAKRFQKLKEQYAAELYKVNESSLLYINGKIPELYTIGFNEISDFYRPEDVGGYYFSVFNPETVRFLAMTDASLLPFKKLDPIKDIPWNMKKINAEVLQGILQGESIPKITKRLIDVQEMNKNASIRTARTLCTAAENKGREDSYEKAEADGIVIEREWVSARNSRTRDAHIELDGQKRKVGVPFENHLGKIMFPGDFHAHPANVYNCRCTLVPHVIGFRRKDGTIIYV